MMWKGFSIERYKGCREKERGMATLAVPVCILYNITTEESSRNGSIILLPISFFLNHLHREIQRLFLQHQPQKVQYWPLKRESTSPSRDTKKDGSHSRPDKRYKWIERNPKTCCKITDLWFVGTWDKSEQAEMVIEDSNQGDQIHAVCKRDQLKSWNPILKENCTYMMHNFKVVKNDGEYRICAHLYKLIFIGVTVIRETLVNVALKTHSFMSALMSEQLVSCTLWEDYCLQFLEYLNECNSEGPIIILLTHARNKESQGSYPTTISNSLKASKLLINQPMSEIEEFKQRFLVLWLGWFDYTYRIKNRGPPNFHAEAKSLSEINKISKVLCNKKTNIDNTPFTCACGCDKYNQQAMLRYRLEVMVYHKEECTNFLLWDRECANLIGQSDDEVNRLKIADGDVDLNVYLEALDKILGYTLAFKVKVQSKFRNFVVLKYSFDSDLINTTIDLLPDIEQSLSATTDHDPLLEVPLTPTKQQTPQVLRGSTEFIDFTCSIFI
ncbi:hypothetical protein HKD37_18G050430 [Glycine soja]